MPQSNQLHLAITKRFVTNQELNDFVADITDIQELLYVAEKEKTSRQVEEFTTKYAPFLKDLNIETQHRSILAEKLQEVKDYANSYEPMRLTLAFIPAERFLEKLQALIEKTMGTRVIFDIRLDVNVIGGTLIDFNGVHLDLSLKKMLSDYFISNKDAILSKV